MILATPTASPPPWFTLAYPAAMPVTRDGVRLTHGSRDTYCAAAPAYRAAARRVAAALATRYGQHPAVALWHVHNEYGKLCWCEHAARAFRSWLEKRYGAAADGLAQLNEAWGTAFWAQCYSAWQQVQLPRATQWRGNPGELPDFRRFWSDELLAAYCEQRDEIRRAAPGVPVTTNLHPAGLPGHRSVGVVPGGGRGRGGPLPVGHRAGGACRHRVRRGTGPVLGRGRGWLLMEQATRLVYANGRVLSLLLGRMLRDSLGYVARGSDSVLFFQWRASRAGAEMWHSAMVPHAGPDTVAFREAAALGAAVQRLGEVAGSTVTARAAVLLDTDSWWALDSQGLRGADLRYLEAVRRDHAALCRAGIVCDLAQPEADLSGYRLLLAPALYLVTDEGAESLRRLVAGGGVLVVSFGSGLVHLGPARSGWADIRERCATCSACGSRSSSCCRNGQTVPLSSGARGATWSELMTVTGAGVLASYAAGPLACPAVTRHEVGQGSAWYLSTELDNPAHDQIIAAAVAAAVPAAEVPGLPAGVEAVRRRGTGDRSWLFLLNHTTEPLVAPADGTELLSGSQVAPSVELPPEGVAVVREQSMPSR